MECNSEEMPASPAPSRAVIIAGFITDFILMSLGFIFNFSFFFFTFPFNVVFLGVIVTICILRRHAALRRAAYDIDLVPLPDSLSLSGNDEALNRRVDWRVQRLVELATP